MHTNYMVKVLQTMGDMTYGTHFVARKKQYNFKRKIQNFATICKKAIFCHFGVWYAGDMKFCKN